MFKIEPYEREYGYEGSWFFILYQKRKSGFFSHNKWDELGRYDTYEEAVRAMQAKITAPPRKTYYYSDQGVPLEYEATTGPR